MSSSTSQTAGNGTLDTPPGQTSTTAESAVAEAFNVIRKRRWVVIAAMVLGILFGLYRAATQPVLYTATGQIEVRGSQGATALGMATAASSFSSDDMQNEVLILTSQSLLLTVAREMNLANNPTLLPPGPARNINDPHVRAAIVGRLQNALMVQSIPRTQMISITCTTGAAQLSADIVNHLINAYQQRSFESRFASTQRVSQWLQSQLDDLKQQVEASQEQLMDLQKRLGVLGLGADATKPLTTQATAAVEALSTAAINAKVQRILAESRYRVLANSDPNLMESTAQSSGVLSGLSSLRSDASATRAQIAQSEVTLGKKNPQLLALQAHLREVEKEIQTEQLRLLTEAKQALVAAQANENQTQSALDQQKDESYRLRDDLVEYTLRQRDYEANRQLYEELLSKLRGASVQAGLDAVAIDVVDPAFKPINPTMTPRSSILIRAALVGLVVGIIIAFTLESLDTGIRGIAEVEQITGLPSLAIIPKVRRMPLDPNSTLTVAQNNIGVLTTSKSQFSEAFRSLRTALLLATTGHPPKILLITSSTPTEGKTTVATNLAAVMAQRETRILLIDADMRRPNVHHRFGLSGRVGLSTVLSGSATLEEAVKSVPEIPNLDVMSSGPVPPFPTEMLSSQSMRDLLARCSEIYTHIVIDTPPVLSVTDAVILARQADAIVIVARQGKSSRNAVRRTRDILVRSGAAVTGVVLNSVDISAPEYHGYYGYSGYSYSNVDMDAWEANGQQGIRRSEESEGDA